VQVSPEIIGIDDTDVEKRINAGHKKILADD
jgi:hypothetical protein